MAGGQRSRLSIDDAVDEILRRQRQTMGAYASPLGSTPAGGSASPSQSAPVSGVRYGNLYAPPSDLAELRRQQAAFAQTTQDLDRQNSWMAIPALAPPLGILGLEGAAALAARFGAPAAAAGPLVLTERMPYLRVGDNYATRIGRRAHQAFKARIAEKPGWDPEPTIGTRRGVMRPDARGPVRTVDPDNPRQYGLELKPDTPSGRRAAARAIKRYEEATRLKMRPVYYDPKTFK